MSLEPSSTPLAATAAHDIAALDGLDQGELRALAHGINRESKLQAEMQLRQARIDALTLEIRLLHHLRFAAKTEAMDAMQVKLFEEANAEDLGAVEHQLAQLGIKCAAATPRSRSTR